MQVPPGQPEIHSETLVSRNKNKDWRYIDQWWKTCLACAKAWVWFSVYHIYLNNIHKHSGLVKAGGGMWPVKLILTSWTCKFLCSVAPWQCKQGTLVFFTNSFGLGLGCLMVVNTRRHHRRNHTNSAELWSLDLASSPQTSSGKAHFESSCSDLHVWRHPSVLDISNYKLSHSHQVNVVPELGFR